MRISLSTTPEGIESTFKHALSIGDTQWAQDIAGGTIGLCGGSQDELAVRTGRLRAIAREHDLEDEVFGEGSGSS